MCPYAYVVYAGKAAAEAIIGAAGVLKLVKPLFKVDNGVVSAGVSLLESVLMTGT